MKEKCIRAGGSKKPLEERNKVIYVSKRFAPSGKRWTLLSLAYNILKLHHKIQKCRLGTGLVIPQGYPAGQ